MKPKPLSVNLAIDPFISWCEMNYLQICLWWKIRQISTSKTLRLHSNLFRTRCQVCVWLLLLLAGLRIMLFAMQLPKRKAEIARCLGQTEDNFLTPQKIQSLRRQLKDLKENQRPAAIVEVQRTQEMGDLSENAAYQEAKFRLRRINSKITIIEEKLKVAIPIQPSDTDTVQIGSQVTLANKQEERTYQIVGSFETNPAQGRISHFSPLGSALLGKKLGEAVEINNQQFIIENIQ